MEVIICETPEEVGRLAAAKVSRVVRDRGPEAVLGLSTGSSPLAAYADLARRIEAGELDLSRARGFALDEYVGLPPGHPESYAEVIRATVTDPLRMDPLRVSCPDGFATDTDAAARHYEEAIKAAGGIDIQILGVGENGHIGFNEPSSSLSSRTRVKTLTRTTREANSRFFETLDDVPRHCLTQGLGTIMDAREVVLMAQGSHKASAIAGLIEGPLSARCPGSVLQLHPAATVIIDRAAAAELEGQEYYEETYRNKPAWQRFEDPAPWK
ncbi:glucosamine-6-phosphate deaminase [Arthrobacter oryzae]|uniref:Glucosamine-6-phosphate deaminase n=1 Tax=Arthrobacter oryzae TaxID=409290 RepID=A0A3N0BNU1_9MICC|nr:glucosamine-6-phosphate deaminase [Arthrobacter oryzae]RNL50383.1 glucosamine-6-phosphate deaminase [Arthrobacter oryzae]